MKKIYIAPQINIVTVDICRMVCVSDGKLDKNSTIDGTTTTFGARGGSWDDDDE